MKRAYEQRVHVPFALTRRNSHRPCCRDASRRNHPAACVSPYHSSRVSTLATTTKALASRANRRD